ncbi:MAG: hypothetical protein JWQ02_1568, partial [Capsulimonas sp.]|nr:hypothetical protein [Capsulimonas sp.]
MVVHHFSNRLLIPVSIRSSSAAVLSSPMLTTKRHTSPKEHQSANSSFNGHSVSAAARMYIFMPRMHS